MVKIRKYANGIERFLHGQKGQRFFNFAYSIGAAVVIWGALFKILHLPGGSSLLCIGMGTEIAMFVLTAFDRPPKEYSWEDVFPVLDSHDPDDRPDFAGGSGINIQGGFVGGEEIAGAESEGQGGDNTITIQGGAGAAGGVISGGVIGGGIIGGGVLSQEDTDSLRDSIQKMAAASDQLAQMAELTTATQDYLHQIAGIADQMSQLRQTTEALNNVSSVLLDSYKAITDNSEHITQSSTGYVAQMDNLNRNISGLNTIYEIQLKGISSQLESIDRVNRGLKDIRDMYEKSANESSRYCEETEKMARYMKQLNQVYEKMITAMTINMSNPMMGGMQGGTNPFGQSESNQNI
jgi:gliding motility-associated protein GldL